MNALAEWVSQPSIKIEMKSNTVNGKCSQWKNNISFTNETEKTVLLQVKASYKLLSNLGLKIFFAPFYHLPNILLRGKKFCVPNMVQQHSKKEEIGKFIFPWIRHVLQITKAHFRYKIWFMVSEKSITRVHVFSPGGPRMYQKSANNTYKKLVLQNFQFFQPLKIDLLSNCDFYRYKHLYTYRKNELRNILEKKLCNCFGQFLLIYKKNVEHGIELDIDVAYGVCIH